MVRLMPIFLSLLAVAPARADDGPAGSKTFQSWIATCNNIGTCVVMGSNEDSGLFYLRIARDAGATAAPSLRIVLALQDRATGDTSMFHLDAKDPTKDGGTSAPLGPFKARAEDSDTPTFTADVTSGENALAVIDKIRNAATLAFAIGGTKGALDLKGLSAALRWIDARQGRAGTPTALVARGMTPIGQVPPPREPPVVVAAPADSVTEISKPVFSSALLKAAAAPDCDPDVLKAHDGAEAWRVGPDKILVSLPCTQGAYNFTSTLYLTDAKGGAPTPMDLPPPPDTPAGTGGGNAVVNASFDPKTLTLTEFNKGRGVSDCGSITSWVWTGKGFALLNAASLDACPGALPDDWPNVYTARRR